MRDRDLFRTTGVGEETFGPNRSVLRVRALLVLSHNVSIFFRSVWFFGGTFSHVFFAAGRGLKVADA